MQLEAALVKQLATTIERVRDPRENALYSLLSDTRTPRLDLDGACEFYNRLQAEQRWAEFAEVGLNCTPLWAGIWAEWRDGNLGNARVGCALIVLPDEAAVDFPGMNLAHIGWQLIAHPVATLPNGKVSILPVAILALIDRQGHPQGCFSMPDDDSADPAAVARMSNFGTNLILTTLLGVSRVHDGVARRSKDGRVIFA